MKNLTSLLALALIAFACGCASSGRAALNTIGTVGATADAAIGAYDTWLQAHPETPIEHVREVRRAVLAYTASIQAARLAVVAYKQGGMDQATLDSALDALSAASAEVVRVITLILTPPRADLAPLEPRPTRLARVTLNNLYR